MATNLATSLTITLFFSLFLLTHARIMSFEPSFIPDESFAPSETGFLPSNQIEPRYVDSDGEHAEISPDVIQEDDIHMKISFDINIRPTNLHRHLRFNLNVDVPREMVQGNEIHREWNDRDRATYVERPFYGYSELQGRFDPMPMWDTAAPALSPSSQEKYLANEIHREWNDRDRATYVERPFYGYSELQGRFDPMPMWDTAAPALSPSSQEKHLEASDVIQSAEVEPPVSTSGHYEGMLKSVMKFFSDFS